MNFLIKIEEEKLREEIYLRKVDTVDRHELEKILNRIDLPFMDNETTEALRKRVRSYLVNTKQRLEDVL